MTENIKKELFAAEFYTLFHTKLENAPSKNELSEFLSGKIVDKNFLCALVLIGKISDWNRALLFKFSDDTKNFIMILSKISIISTIQILPFPILRQIFHKRLISWFRDWKKKKILRDAYKILRIKFGKIKNPSK
jgi:hypothetical protein